MITRAETNRIVVHCSDTPPAMEIGVKEIRRWHVEERRFSDIAYHYVIRRRQGRIERGRPVHVMGAHARGFNKDTIGICLVGGQDAKGKPAANFTYMQMQSLFELIDSLRVTYVEELPAVGHRDLAGVNKDCPCFDVAHWEATGELRP